jgi:steroid 5-alpha reductase family enzyme
MADPVQVALSLGTAVLAAVAVMTVTALVARRQGRVVVVDVAWGLGFVVVAAACALVATAVRAGE